MNERRSPRELTVSPELATRVVEDLVYERVREVVDFCCLYELDNYFRHVLMDCGVPRVDAPGYIAELVARSFARIADEYVTTSETLRMPSTTPTHAAAPRDAGTAPKGAS